MIHSDGNLYLGEWKDDKANGFGISKHVDGNIYKGFWKDDK